MRAALLSLIFILFLIAEVNALTFWSNETREYFMGESKLIIDHNSYVNDYDLDEGWVKIHTNITTLLSFCDPFSGRWVKKVVKRGDVNVTLPFKPKTYAGMKLLVISSPWGFGILKERAEPLSWYDYPIVILRTEMAKWSWERTAYALGLFVVGLALSRHMKKDRLIVSGSRHLIVMAFAVLILFGILSMKYTTETVKVNETVRKIPHLVFDTYYIKEWYNYFFAFCFVSGYVLGYLLWGYNRLYVAYVGYSQPLRIHVYPYDMERGVIRDFDGKLTLIDFKDDFRQFINFELNGYNVNGILAVREENVRYPDYQRQPVKLGYALAGFFGFLALSIVGDYLYVFKIDLLYSFLFGGIIAILTNIQAVKEWFGYYVEKIKVIECSELMNEDNYTKMLKEAEIKHVIEDYERLLRDHVKEKITMPRRTVKQLLSMIRQVRVAKVEEKPKREDHDKDKD